MAGGTALAQIILALFGMQIHRMIAPHSMTF
jgi:hypothetical protein